MATGSAAGQCLEVRVLDQSAAAIAGASVLIGDQEQTTDESGTVEFCDLGPAPHAVVIVAPNFQVLEDLVDSQMYDPASGLVGLLEGDAIVAEFVYFNTLDAAAQSRLITEFDALEQPELDIPLFMELALQFPYDQGFAYVANRWREGGWPAVNNMYLDPPGSTEEIYLGAPSPATEVVEMERPAGALPEEYEVIYDYTWGFLDILVMFQQVLGPDAALRAATGWGGGRSLVGYSQEGEVVFVWEYAGDTQDEADELVALLGGYAKGAMHVGELQFREDLGFSASGEDYVFVAPVPPGMVMVACSDPEVCPSVTAPYLP